MFATVIGKASVMKRLVPLGLTALGVLLAAAAQAAAPGITGPTFSLQAKDAYITQPDGQSVYSWGYGCSGAPTGFKPVAIGTGAGANCGVMQLPGPTLIVTEGQTVMVTLTNNLPAAAGSTSILFPGFNVTTSCSAATPVGVQGLLTCEAAPNGTVTYSFTAGSPGTRAYYSGTQGDLQVEMGLYGAIIVLPANVPMACSKGLPSTNPGFNAVAQQHWGETDFRNAEAAYNNAATCYDREYLFQFSEMDPSIHSAVQDQVSAKKGCVAGAIGCSLNVPTEPYHPAYFMVNGRSMPDDMDPNYAPMYPHQPYNGNPHMHPGEITLLRIVGQGRWQHPFHEHGNHVRILARDGNLLLTAKENLAGPLMFTTTTTPGMAMDGLFYYTGKGLNWDMYGHNPASADTEAKLSCTPDANGYNTSAPTAINYFEWCQDHNKPMQATPFGDVPAGGPMTLPDPNILLNGTWYGGSPYLGPNATTRATYGTCDYRISSIVVTAAGSGYKTAPTVNIVGGGGSGATATATVAQGPGQGSGMVTAIKIVNAGNGYTTAPTVSFAGGGGTGATATAASSLCSTTGTTPPSGTIANNPGTEAGFSFMWHSHNEREITTNNIFPGGMMMMMLVDSREFVIDESQ